MSVKMRQKIIRGQEVQNSAVLKNMLKKIKQLPQHKKVPSSSLIKIIKISLVVFVVGVVLEVLIINRLSTFGAKINQIEKEKSQLELENADLKDKLFNKISLDKTSKKAMEVGFEPIKSIEYIK